MDLRKKCDRLPEKQGEEADDLQVRHLGDSSRQIIIFFFRFYFFLLLLEK